MYTLWCNFWLTLVGRAMTAQFWWLPFHYLLTQALVKRRKIKRTGTTHFCLTTVVWRTVGRQLSGKRRVPKLWWHCSTTKVTQHFASLGTIVLTGKRRNFQCDSVLFRSPPLLSHDDWSPLQLPAEICGRCISRIHFVFARVIFYVRFT